MLKNVYREIPHNTRLLFWPEDISGLYYGDPFKGELVRLSEIITDWEKERTVLPEVLEVASAAVAESDFTAPDRVSPQFRWEATYLMVCEILNYLGGPASVHEILQETKRRRSARGFPD